jgi:hypothetical protein
LIVVTQLLPLVATTFVADAIVPGLHQRYQRYRQVYCLYSLLILPAL